MGKLRLAFSLLICSQFVIPQLQARETIISVNSGVSKLLTLREPGKYILDEHLNFAPGTSSSSGITITADNVLLDLRGYTIAQQDQSAKFTAITITPNRNNITISNGTISQCTGLGLAIQNNCSNITLTQLNVNQCGGAIQILNTNNCWLNQLQLTNQQQSGLQLQQCTNFKLSEIAVNGTCAPRVVHAFALYNCSNCTLTHCNANNNQSATTSGYLLELCNGCILRNCKANNNQARPVGTSQATSVAGFTLNNSFNCHLEQCFALSNTSAGLQAYGFALNNSSRTILQDCAAVYNSVSTTITDQPSMTYGFYSGLNQQTICANIFDRCQATGNAGSDAPGTLSGSAGFYLDGSETGSSILNSIADGNYGGTGDGIGIFIAGARLCTIKNNRVLTNVGKGPKGGYGIYDSATNSRNLYMSNFAFGNGTCDHTIINNYAVSLAPDNDLTLFPSTIAYINNFKNLAAPGTSNYNIEVIERPLKDDK